MKIGLLKAIISPI